MADDDLGQRAKALLSSKQEELDTSLNRTASAGNIYFYYLCKILMQQ